MKKTLLFVIGSVLCASLVLAQTPTTSTTSSTTKTTKTTKDKAKTKGAAPAAAAPANGAPTPAAAPAKTATVATPAAKTTKPAAAPTPPPSAGDIASAKTKGLVWVNLNTKVYHGSADKEYGTTKNGKFMTESDAKAAGARAAKH